MTKNLAPETIAAQAGGAMDEETGGIVPPLHLTTTFVRDPDNQYRKGYVYGRADNATVRQVEDVLTQLEGGAASLLFASGMAAATTAFLALGRRRTWSRRASCTGACAAGCWRTRQRSASRSSFVDADRSSTPCAPRCGRAGPAWSGSRRPPTRCGRSPTSPAPPSIAHAPARVLAVDSTVRDAGADPARSRSAPTLSCTRRPNI